LCAALRKVRARYADSGGLYFEVQATGSKYWRWKYRFAGKKKKRLALGAYPEVSLATAWAQRDRARVVVKSGADPVLSKKEAKLSSALRLNDTFEAVARSWFEHWKTPRSPRHAQYVIRRLELDVFPVVGASPSARSRPLCCSRWPSASKPEARSISPDAADR
jgi:hypothetical protein